MIVTKGGVVCDMQKQFETKYEKAVNEVNLLGMIKKEKRITANT